jgi:thiamine transporter
VVSPDEKRSRVISEMAISIALAFILRSYAVIIRMPNGGSATLGNLPILLFSFRRGAKSGIVCGLICGLLKALFSFRVPPVFDPVILFLAMFFDYALAYLCLGLAPLFLFKKKTLLRTLFSVGLSYVVKLFCHIISGIFVWKNIITDHVHRLGLVVIYNLAYVLPEMIIVIIFCCIAFRLKVFRKMIFSRIL